MKTIQLRNVPQPLHRKLKKRAASAGVSVSDYLLNQFRRIAEQPTDEELQKRSAKLNRVSASVGRQKKRRSADQRGI